MGASGYSYNILIEQFTPLLQRWGKVIRVNDPQLGLDAEVEKVRRRNLDPIHFAFAPLQDVFLAQSAPNVVLPMWEFPNIPDHAFNNDPQNDWVAMSAKCDGLIVSGPFTEQSFRSAGVDVPIHIVPVPTPQKYYQIPTWKAEDTSVIDCPSYVFSNVNIKLEEIYPPPEETRPGVSRTLKSIVRWGVKKAASVIPADLRSRLASVYDCGRWAWDMRERTVRPHDANMNLHGVVYTSILNPQDDRKNWQDMLTGFLFALGDCADATLVVKLVSADAEQLNRVIRFYEKMCLSHRCQVIFVADYLTDEQMLQLTTASTYYVATSRAEGSCLPLMNFLAAGRPAVSPRHTAISDYFDEEIGFVVDSHPEPTAFPHDPRWRKTTTWHRLVWTSLVDQLRESYRVAKESHGVYASLAQRARERVELWSSAENVWPRLESALEQVAGCCPASAAWEKGVAAA